MIVAAGIGLLACAHPSESFAEGYTLLTVEEYAERTERPPTRSINRLANEGPEIIVHAPQKASSLFSPLDFDVEFRAREAEPDLATLKLEYDLGLFWKDVTERMSGHAEVSGNRLVSRGAELPAGDHHLRMSISDLAGKTTATEFIFTVAD
ncbi:MAG: hypothetical protein ACR2QF_00840 [Geminicoccaceae bacterium]